MLLFASVIEILLQGYQHFVSKQITHWFHHSCGTMCLFIHQLVPSLLQLILSYLILICFCWPSNRVYRCVCACMWIWVCGCLWTRSNVFMALPSLSWPSQMERSLPNSKPMKLHGFTSLDFTGGPWHTANRPTKNGTNGTPWHLGDVGVCTAPPATVEHRSNATSFGVFFAQVEVSRSSHALRFRQLLQGFWVKFGRAVGSWDQIDSCCSTVGSDFNMEFHNGVRSWELQVVCLSLTFTIFKIMTRKQTENPTSSKCFHHILQHVILCTCSAFRYTSLEFLSILTCFDVVRSEL